MTPATAKTDSSQHKRVSLPSLKISNSNTNTTDEDDFEDFEDEEEAGAESEKQQEEDEQLCFALSRLDNPFLLFLCLSIFMEKRDYIMKLQMDANDVACFFDKMTRRHDLKSVLNRARYLYTKLYLSKTNFFNYIHNAMEI